MVGFNLIDFIPYGVALIMILAIVAVISNMRLEKKEIKMKKLYFERMDAYCPHDNCNKEMYGPSVYGILTEGGRCVWCNQYIDKGESINWGTLEGKEINSCDMDVQHISNILHMLEYKDLEDTNTYNVFIEELKSRNETRLPYKQYYPSNIESRIYR